MSRRDITVYQYGDTIRFEVEFFDYDGTTRITPENVTLKIYNSKYEQIDTESGLPHPDAVVGKFYYDYTTAPVEARLYYEWNATIGGKVSLRRGMFMTLFVE